MITKVNENYYGTYSLFNFGFSAEKIDDITDIYYSYVYQKGRITPGGQKIKDLEVVFNDLIDGEISFVFNDIIISDDDSVISDQKTASCHFDGDSIYKALFKRGDCNCHT